MFKFKVHKAYFFNWMLQNFLITNFRVSCTSFHCFFSGQAVAFCFKFWSARRHLLFCPLKQHVFPVLFSGGHTCFTHYFIFNGWPSGCCKIVRRSAALHLPFHRLIISRSIVYPADKVYPLTNEVRTLSIAVFKTRYTYFTIHILRLVASDILLMVNK